MTAAAEIEPTTEDLEPHYEEEPTTNDLGPHYEEEVSAERTFVHSAMIGALIGAVICAGLWIGIVAIATTHNGTRSWPLLLMGAGCGMFAGLFLGGWAGSMVGSKALEEAHHDSLPRVK